MKEIVIGESDFKRVLVRDNYYIDKTILILKSPIEGRFCFGQNIQRGKI